MTPKLSLVVSFPVTDARWGADGDVSQIKTARPKLLASYLALSALLARGCNHDLFTVTSDDIPDTDNANSY